MATAERQQVPAQPGGGGGPVGPQQQAAAGGAQQAAPAAGQAPAAGGQGAQAGAVSPHAAAASTGAAAPPLAAAASIDVPPDPFAEYPVTSDLHLKSFTLKFADARDEGLFAAWRWKLQRPLFQVTLVLLLAFTITLSFDHNLPNYSTIPALYAIFVCMRIVPLLALALATLLPREFVVRWWSAACALALLVWASSAPVYMYVCSLEDVARVTPQCRLLNTVELMPWLPVVFLPLLPLVLSLGMRVTWFDMVWSSIAYLGLFIGLTLVQAADEMIATTILLWFTSVACAAQASYMHDFELRAAFKRETAVRRKLQSLIGASLTRIVTQEQSQRIAELLKRTDVVFSELSAAGIVLWISPGCRQLYACEPEEMLRCDIRAWVHGDDLALVRETLSRVTTAGNAVAAASGIATRTGSYAVMTAPDVVPPGLDLSSLHARLTYRRRRGDRDWVWVEADAHAIVRRPTFVPGISTPTPPGETTILMLERDITADRRRAGLGSAGSAALLPSAVQTSITSGIPSGTATLPLVSGLGAGSRPESTLSIATRSPSQPQPETVPRPTPAYDPFHERAIFTTLVAGMLPAAAIRTLIKVSKGYAAGANGGRDRDGADAADVDTAEAVAQSAPGEIMAATLECSELTHDALVEVLGIARYRCQYMPIHPAVGLDIRAVVARAAMIGRYRLVHQGTPEIRLIVSVEDHVPVVVTADHMKTRHLVNIAVLAAVSAARSHSIAVNIRVGTAPIEPPPGRTHEEHQFNVLRCEVCFNAAGVGGVAAIADALAADPVTSEALFAPAAIDAVDTSHASRSPPYSESLSFRMLLPVLRHITLCLGGEISAGTGNLPVGPEGTHTDADADTVMVAVDIPLGSEPRALVGGPTCPEPAVVRTSLAAAPVERVPAPPAPAVGAPGTGAAAIGAPAVAPRLPGREPAVLPTAAGTAPAATVPATALAPAVAGAAGFAGDATAAAPAPVPEAAGLNVLFVDDEHVNRRLGNRMLERLGCRRLLLEDGDQVAAALRDSTTPFDVILMDILMQRTNGAAVCQELREAGVTLPIIAMTGILGIRDVQSFMAAGFDLVLPKPFDIRALERAIVEGRARRQRVNAAAATAGASMQLVDRMAQAPDPRR